ncbi:MAG: hypothetical protein U0326_07585 [Polyangiales bacterium]
MRPPLHYLALLCVLSSCTVLYPFSDFSFDGGSRDAALDADVSDVTAPDAPDDATPDATPPDAPDDVTPPTDVAPVDVAPDDVAPVDVPPVDVAPVDVPPVDVAPVDVPPVDVSPVDVPPVDVPPVDVAPIDVAPVDVALDRPDVSDAMMLDVASDAGCPAGTTRCGGVCVDATTDRNNCGGCGRVCAVACSSGTCVTVTDVRAGSGNDLGVHACALLSDRTVRCWGSNVYGELGDGTRTNRSRPVPVVGLRDVSEIAVGGTHTCALLGDGTVSCWGSGASLQLGDGTSQRSTPATVPGLGHVVSVAAGAGHSCALRGDNMVFCWGRNTFGACGVAPLTDVLAPSLVNGTGLIGRLATGGLHTCATGLDGAARCWGAGTTGALGDGRSVTSVTPVTAGGFSAGTISAGDEDSCSVARDRTVWCWGQNRYGAVGNGTNNQQSTPAQVRTLPTASAVSVGSFHTCALDGDGVVFCWGFNNEGQIGEQGGLSQRNTPGRVATSVNARAISCGYQFTCAALSDGSAQCWGRNTQGQLGDGTTATRRLAAPVLF